MKGEGSGEPHSVSRRVSNLQLFLAGLQEQQENKQ